MLPAGTLLRMFVDGGAGRTRFHACESLVAVSQDGRGQRLSSTDSVEGGHSFVVLLSVLEMRRVGAVRAWLRKQEAWL